ncbi:MAG: cytosol nonspecific dipeptidase [Candidatus Aminicenantes bacterium RBG_16_63_16]|nr:MAG: cytosol nonspecific dipeptidase [Candidatus Aminicenantes bacterium RBG_16_63_16]
MADPLEGLKPSVLWRHFAEILKIPHCSGNERPLGDYILGVAKGLNLAAKRDKPGNVVVAKPASPGHENAPGTILQGHLDMVCEKNSDVVHDFTKDAIIPQIKGDWVYASGTTLGSDNGIGCAAALAAMGDASLVHGPLEFLFTVDEETGLTGANRLQKGFLKGTNLLNLDSEEAGAFTIGCSGGGDSEITLPVARKRRRFKDLYELKLFGFRGGHSGLDINQGRGNAVRLLARLLYDAQEKFKFELLALDGGNKRNAIPREAVAKLYVEGADAKKLKGHLKTKFTEIYNEYKTVEKEAGFSFEKAAPSRDDPLAASSQKTLLGLLLALPHGVLSMHPAIAGLVETSSNLAIVHTEKKQAKVICSSRSSVASALTAVRKGIKATSELAGAQIVQSMGYPGWEPNLESPLLAKLKAVHSRVFGQEPHVIAVHAGLECGIIGEKFPGMDMISFGPAIEHPHSPEERVHFPSVEDFWKFLAATLAELA